MHDAFVLRDLVRADAEAALALYSELTLGPPCTAPEAFFTVLDHPGTSITGAFDQVGLVSMATLHLLPNVTWNARPYGVVENVVTRSDQRKRGFGRAVLDRLLAKAWAVDAYKVMLLTGQKRGALGFYQAVGFTQEDKHGLVIRRP